MVVDRSGNVTDTVLMVRPRHFHFDLGTSKDNLFQHNIPLSANAEERNAREEFDDAVKLLRDYKINVICIEDLKNVENPDSIFPNNWFSTHNNGYVITYPMFCESRRKERRKDIIDLLTEDYEVTKQVDLTPYEKENIFLESTGSMVFDHEQKLVYATLSCRTSKRLIDLVCELLNYKSITFDTKSLGARPVYHTNVLMAVGKHYVICCTEIITPEEAKKQVIESVKAGGKELVEITQEQMQKFAGNVLELQNSDGQLLTVMSVTAYRALNDKQISVISKHSKIITPDIPIIEIVGGGGIRCMMVQIFLKDKH